MSTDDAIDSFTRFLDDVTGNESFDFNFTEPGQLSMREAEDDLPSMKVNIITCHLSLFLPCYPSSVPGGRSANVVHRLPGCDL